MSVVQERATFRDSYASVALDAMRGIAALLVLLDHCHNLFFVNLGIAMHDASHPRLLMTLYAINGTGVEAVVIFFVLSGYLISSSVLRAFEQGRWSWKEYLTHRLVRLWLVLLPAFVLGGLWDCGRLARLNHGEGAGSLIARMAADGFTWKIFFGNVFFLQEIHTVNFGSNRVLWSLAAEFWYYILFPLGWIAVRRGSSPRARILSGFGFVLVAAFLTKGVLALFPVWLFGVALAMVKPATLKKSTRWIAVVLYVPCVLKLALTEWPWHYFKMDYFLGALTTVFLWVLLSANGRADERALAVRIARRLAGFSYSLYLVHYPLLLFFAAILTHGGPWMPTPRFLAMAAVLCLLAIIYAYGVASATEFHNETVRRWVERRLGLSPRVRLPTR